MLVGDGRVGRTFMLRSLPHNACTRKNEPSNDAARCVLSMRDRGGVEDGHWSLSRAMLQPGERLRDGEAAAVVHHIIGKRHCHAWAME